jgi:hypothetical protein
MADNSTTALEAKIAALSEELSFVCHYYSKDPCQWRVALLVPKQHKERVIAEFAKYGLHQVGDLAPAGDYVAGIFQTAQWRD